MGRTPDYMNVKFASFASRSGAWAGPGGVNAEGAENLVRFQRRLAREDLSLTHTIIHPTVDKATDARIVGSGVPLHKVEDTAHGIVVRGARILATLAPYADEIAVYPALPMPADATAYALAFSIPVDTPGLIFLCRDSAAAPGAHPFDRPLSSRFDEQDAFVIFDNVEVPRERVFIDGSVDVYNVIRQTEVVENLTNQTTVRALTKLEFSYGLAARMAEAINDQSAATQEMLGELLSYVETTRSAVLLSAEHGRDVGDGVWCPDRRPLAPMRSLLATWFPRVAEIITLIGSHNLLATPSRRQLDDAELRPLIDEFLHGANGVGAEARAALFRLAWDFVGSGLAGRNLLYERFYLTSAARNRISAHLANTDRSRPYGLVDDILGAGLDAGTPDRLALGGAARAGLGEVRLVDVRDRIRVEPPLALLGAEVERHALEFRLCDGRDRGDFHPADWIEPHMTLPERYVRRPRGATTTRPRKGGATGAASAIRGLPRSKGPGTAAAGSFLRGAIRARQPWRRHSPERDQGTRADSILLPPRRNEHTRATARTPRHAP